MLNGDRGTYLGRAITRWHFDCRVPAGLELDPWLSFFLLLSGLSLNVGVGATRQHVFGTGKSLTSDPQRPRSKSPKCRATTRTISTTRASLPPLKVSPQTTPLSRTLSTRVTASVSRNPLFATAPSTHPLGTLTSTLATSFYFFESRRDLAQDDMIFRTNRGLGCSSAIGLFMSWARAGSSRRQRKLAETTRSLRLSSSITCNHGMSLQTCSLLINWSVLAFVQGEGCKPVLVSFCSAL